MDRQEAIKRLKENTSAFGLMDRELQELAKELEDQTVRYSIRGAWEVCPMYRCTSPHAINDIFRLRPDYTEEPEEIVCEVYVNGQGTRLLVKHGGAIDFLSDAIAWIPQEGFRFDRAVFKTDNDVFCSYTGVTARVGDKTVHAVQVVYRKQ